MANQELDSLSWLGMGNSLPFACQDRAAIQAAYRLLSSDRIDEQTLLQGHAEATCQRIHALEKETVLLLPDTTTFGYHQDNPEAVGCGLFKKQAFRTIFSHIQTDPL